MSYHSGTEHGGSLVLPVERTFLGLECLGANKLRILGTCSEVDADEGGWQTLMVPLCLCVFGNLVPSAFGFLPGPGAVSRFSQGQFRAVSLENWNPRT